MSKKEIPLVSIGLPVFNGEQYLEEAIHSILNQTFRDFELIISDNASTDGTEFICRQLAKKDPRIRYVRMNENQGAAQNFNSVVHLARGKYFKWCAHDDLLAPEFLQYCVEILEKDPQTVIAHTETIMINEQGIEIASLDDFMDLRSSHPEIRLRQYLFRHSGLCNAILGLTRLNILQQTPLMESYISSDRVLLGELVLRGKITRVPQPFFYRRYHPSNSWRANTTLKSLATWLDPKSKNPIQLPPGWRHLVEYLRTIRRVPLTGRERLGCYLAMIKWSAKQALWPTQRYVLGKIGRLPPHPLDQTILSDLSDPGSGELQAQLKKGGV
jgi:glycosyltransferase involved in cell wall biosynthesis